MPARKEPNLGLNYDWSLGEAGWKAGMDANLVQLGATVQLAVASRTAAQPAAPAAGARYIVPTGATGTAWAGHDDEIALYVDGAWRFYTPGEGWWVRVVDEDTRYEYKAGSGWVEFKSGSSLQNNDTATTDPTANDDSTAGYSVRSAWINTATGEIFRALDVTPGAAVWVKTTLTLDELGSAATKDVGTEPDQVPTTAEADGRYAQRGNLIINGDFAINQRGFAGGTLAPGEYGYDRWGTPSAGAGADVSVTSGVVTLASGTLVQAIEAPELAGQVITVSAENPSAEMTVDVEGVIGTIPAGIGRRGVTLTVPGTSTGDISVKLSSASSVSFSRVKAERGRFATPWVPRFEGVELALCRRYFSILGDQRGLQAVYSVVDLGTMRNEFDARFVFRIGTALRSIPEIVISDLTKVALESLPQSVVTNESPSDFNVYNDSPVSFQLSVVFSSSTGFPAGSPVNLQIREGGFVYADAELPI